jgi:hypothetical protein
MGRWGDAADKATGPSDYLKLSDGTDTRIRVLTDPVVENKTFDSDPLNPKTVFSWIVWDYNNALPKILSKGPSFIRKFDFISEQWGDEIPMKCDIVIKTTGSKLNTQYDITAVPPMGELPGFWQARVDELLAKNLLPNAIPIEEFLKDDNNTKSFSDAAPAPALSANQAINEIPRSVAETFGTDTVITDFDEDEPINLDDIPF